VLSKELKYCGKTQKEGSL